MYLVVELWTTFTLGTCLRFTFFFFHNESIMYVNKSFKTALAQQLLHALTIILSTGPPCWSVPTLWLCPQHCKKCSVAFLWLGGTSKESCTGLHCTYFKDKRIWGGENQCSKAHINCSTYRAVTSQITVCGPSYAKAPMRTKTQFVLKFVWSCSGVTL